MRFLAVVVFAYFVAALAAAISHHFTLLVVELALAAGVAGYIWLRRRKNQGDQ